MSDEMVSSTSVMPLVSVIVITYNSSKYVLETLNSIKDQSYENIELIISDDCSPDDTVNVVEDWVRDNRENFFSVEVVRANKNTGIAPNCNRGLLLAKGDWVKMIAGDDLLFPNAIKNMVEFVKNNVECNVLFGRIQYLKNGNLTVDTIPEIFQLDQRAQQIKNLMGSGIKAPSSFLKRSVLLSNGGFDEAYPMIEDVPMWIKLSLHGHKFHFVNEFIAKYRIHDDNISMTSSKNSEFIKRHYYRSHERLIKQLIIPALYKEKKWVSIFELINYVVVARIIIFFGNRNNFFSTFVNLLNLKNTANRILCRITFFRKST
jgi:alpha-1,3-rhamnosyltransferase